MTALPQGFVVHTRKEWEEINASDDPAIHRQVNLALRSLKLQAGMFLKTGFDKVSCLMQYQEAAGISEENQVAKAAKPKAGEKPTAAPEPVAHETLAAAKLPSVAAKLASASSSTDLTELALRKQLSDLQAQIVDVSKVVIDISKVVNDAITLIRDSQYMLHIQILSDETLSRNVEGSDVREEYYGKILPGND